MLDTQLTKFTSIFILIKCDLKSLKLLSQNNLNAFLQQFSERASGCNPIEKC